MLGIRLDPAAESSLDRFARRSGRSKSDIGREAIREYLSRYDEDEEFLRQVTLLASSPDEDRAAARARTSAWLRALDEEDGGYDWGPNGPPL